MKKYIFTGSYPMPFEFKEGEELKEVKLIPGEPCELPASNESVRNMLVKGYLQAAKEEKAVRKQ